MIDLTPLVEAIITLAATAITLFLIPWLRERYGVETWKPVFLSLDNLYLKAPPAPPAQARPSPPDTAPGHGAKAALRDRTADAATHPHP